MAERRLEVAEVSRATKLDPGTITDFLAGSRWPRNASLARLDAFFDWEPGTLANLAARAEPTPPAGLVLDVDEGVLAGLTAAEREEVLAAARLAAMRTAREIRQSRR